MRGLSGGTDSLTVRKHLALPHVEALVGGWIYRVRVCKGAIKLRTMPPLESCLLHPNFCEGHPDGYIKSSPPELEVYSGFLARFEVW